LQILITIVKGSLLNFTIIFNILVLLRHLLIYPPFFFQPSFNYPSDAESEMKLQNVLNARRSILL